jgi:hypothetical protein
MYPYCDASLTIGVIRQACQVTFRSRSQFVQWHADSIPNAERFAYAGAYCRAAPFQ